MSGVSADAANKRLCSRCGKPITPDAFVLATAVSLIADTPGPLVAAELRRGAAAAMAVSAWLNGFCSTRCMATSSLKAVVDGTAWWSRSGGGS